MQKLVILEGPDNTGKTTLAREICTYAEWVYLHGIKVALDRDPEVIQVTQSRYHGNMLDIAAFNMSTGNNVVIDRHWISHLVYSGNQNILDPYGVNFHNRIKAMEGHYIFCLSDHGEFMYTRNIDPDHPYSKEEYKRYCSTYRGMYQAFKSRYKNVHLYDFDLHGKDITHFLNNTIL